ncbi:protein-glutamate O-methyltransferase family protein [Actinospica sp. MGRD01-02]|uniref:Protein-glutamate O-methyltransferase family protein n=1 Tax=Actinospica acidithermotolerans TaxID=2828514 RepID=A0A941INZ8_9ACTN|nr:damage-control phosphatase ARMT1 family protein [Actinospica acidithermotolerans]MBR7829961.1 protein-glutamate O-methyltransferase family protein [Actinospica acidithermotolerans]
MSLAADSLGLPEARVVTAADPAEFAYTVFHDRHPRLFAQVRHALPYGPAQLDALHRLEEETLTGTLQPLDPGAELAAAGDRAEWTEWGAPYFGRGLRWTDVPFLWSESYFYRRLLSATGYFAGPWRGVDPFGPMKADGLAGAAVDRELAAYGALDGMSAAERDSAVLHACVAGNQADLGFQLIAGAPVGVSLIVDDSAAIWAHLNEREPGRVNLVADNAAEELLPDLLLIEHLITTGRATSATVYLKPRPYYVSDAMTQDAVALLRRLVAAPGLAGDAGRRLWGYCTDGRVRFEAPAFFCSPFGFHAFPPEIVAAIGSATLTVFKGDLNYRRLVGDRFWPVTTPFADLTGYLPGPVAALRTCKSEVAVGLTEAAAAALDAGSPDWRFAGRHAVIQFTEVRR